MRKSEKAIIYQLKLKFAKRNDIVMKLEGVNQITKLCKKKIACLRTGLR